MNLSKASSIPRHHSFFWYDYDKEISRHVFVEHAHAPFIKLGVYSDGVSEETFTLVSEISVRDFL